MRQASPRQAKRIDEMTWPERQVWEREEEVRARKRELAARTYDGLKAAGLCVACRQPAAPRTVCEPCVEKRGAQRRARAEARRPAREAERAARASRRVARNAERARNRYFDLKEAGLCVVCETLDVGVRADGEKRTVCEACQTKRNETRKAARRAKRTERTTPPDVGV